MLARFKKRSSPRARLNGDQEEGSWDPQQQEFLGLSFWSASCESAAPRHLK